MKRIAILIGSPGDPYLEGVAFDLRNVKNFLMSSNGGAWSDTEIFTFGNNPSTGQISPYLDRCSEYDFAFVYFSGHGYTDNYGNAMLSLNSQKHIFVSDLDNRCKRQITIIDACRGYAEDSNYTGLSGIEQENFDYDNLDESRLAFLSCLKEHSNGRVLLQASQKGQNAKDLGYGIGGYFSTNLLKSAIELSTNVNKSVLNISEVFSLAYAKTKNKHQPTIGFVGLGDLLPFAIKSNAKLPVKEDNFFQSILKNLSPTEAAVGTVFLLGIGIFAIDFLTSKKK